MSKAALGKDYTEWISRAVRQAGTRTRVEGQTKLTTISLEMDTKPPPMYTESCVKQLEMGTQKRREIPFKDFYDLDNTINFLSQNNYKKVCQPKAGLRRINH